VKIVIIGAGHGGLQAAKELSKNGFQVTVYEKNSPQEVSYDWRDDVEPTVFEELKIVLPDNSRKTGRTSFVAPFSETPHYMENEENAVEWSIKRNSFVLLLVKLAEEAGAKIKFNTPVQSVIIENNEALQREDLTNMSREILKAYKENKTGLKKSNYIAKSCNETNYAIFGV
jgi:flavin-dependent dehydrogenase